MATKGKGKAKVEKVMKEHKQGKLKSSSGKKVTKPQAGGRDHALSEDAPFGIRSRKSATAKRESS